jgi:hypothetical protein
MGTGAMIYISGFIKIGAGIIEVDMSRVHRQQAYFPPPPKSDKWANEKLKRAENVQARMKNCFIEDIDIGF